MGGSDDRVGQLTTAASVPFFRWHDSGDLQGADHLKKIFEVCNASTAGAALDAHA